MPTFEITSPDGIKYHVEGPDGSTEDDALAQVQAQHTPPAKMGDGPMPMSFAERIAAKMPNILSPKDESRYRGALMGAAAPVVGVAQAAAHALGGGQEMDTAIADKENQYQADRAASGRSGFDAAKMAGGMISPASVGAMKFVPYLSGAAGMLPRAAQYLGNVGIAAGAGAAINSLDPAEMQNGQSYGDAKLEQAKAGAIGGAIAGGVAAPLVQLAARGVGWAIDLLKGRSADVKAGQIVRQAYGADASAGQALNAAAQPTDTAVQASAGLNNDVVDALGALVKRNDKSSWYARNAAAQNAAAEAQIAGQAGGGTQAAARDTLVAGKDALNAEFKPRMQWDLDAANQGKQIASDQAAIANLNQQAASKVEDVRRFSAAADRAENMGTEFGRRNPATGLGQPTGMPSAGKQYSYGQELAGRAENFAQNAADQSLQLGAQGRMTQSFLDAIDRAGFKPLDTNSIIGSIQSKLSDPSAAGNRPYEKVLTNVANDIAEWTARNGGQIDSQALYAIRKNSINSAVQDLLKGADPKSAAKLAAQTVSEVKPLIDQAIVDAGGSAWPQTLKLYEKGMLQLDRKEMGATALDLFKKNKPGFVDLVKGDNLQAPQEVFGPGRYDFAKEMGGKMRTYDPIANQVQRDTQIAEGANRGAGGLTRVLKDNISGFRIPNPLNHNVTLANDALAAMETRLNSATMDRLIEGMKSGKSANQLMNELPTSQQENFLKILLDSAGGRAALVSGSAAAR